MYDREERLNKGVKVAIFFAIVILAVMVMRGCARAETGTASWYSTASCLREGTSGRITASGERFLEDDLTCASWKYAFGTRLKVTNLINGKSVWVWVTDRGPSKRLVRKGRIIDLTKYAFNQIAPLSRGVVPVKVEVVSYAKAEGR